MTCENPRCDNGWVTVTVAYADRRVPEPTFPEDEGPEADAVRALMASAYAAAHTAAEQTVYPCKTCQPALFFRWTMGHLDADHDRLSCDECTTPTGRRRRARSSVPDTPERADLR